MKGYEDLPSGDEEREAGEARARIRKLGYEAGKYYDPTIIVTRRGVDQLGGLRNLIEEVQAGFNAGYVFPWQIHEVSDSVKANIPKVDIRVHEPMSQRNRISAAILTSIASIAFVVQAADHGPNQYDNDGRTSVVETETSDQVVPETTPDENHMSDQEQIYPTNVR